MSKKILISLLLLITFIISGYGQNGNKPSYTEGISKFLLWITNINKTLLGIDNTENMVALSRNLGYISLHINRIAEQKLILEKEIQAANVAKGDTSRHRAEISSKVTKQIDEISEDINALSRYFQEIKA